MKKTAKYALALFSTVFTTTVLATDVNIATVNNAHMIEMQKLTPEFERQHPDIKLKWHIYNEGSLRMRAIADIASGGGHYDVVTIGLYEAPIWAKRDWLVPLEMKANYDVNDLLPPIRSGLSYKDKLYAAPFYGESSMLMYRKDLLSKAGLSFDKRPSWDEVVTAAKAMHDPDNNVYGICLRGKPGWGDNMALVSTIVNSFGGRWFDMQWQPEINSDIWHKAVSFYVDLLNNYGPPNPEHNSFTEILALSRAGQCGMWVDASVAASFLTDSTQSDVANQWAYAESPYQATTQGASWLWAWSLAIPKKAVNVDAAQQFINWATSKEYIKLIASENGWANVPTGTRSSTYKNPDYIQAVGDFAQAELTALNNADPNDNTLPPSPYSGIQFVPIPEFVSIGGATGQKVTEALEGKISVSQALNSAQKIAVREMKRAGYYDEQEAKLVQQAEAARAQQAEVARVKQAQIELAQQAEVARIQQAKTELAQQAEVARIQQAKIELAQQAEVARIQQANIELAQQAEATRIQQAKTELAQQAETVQQTEVGLTTPVAIEAPIE